MLFEKKEKLMGIPLASTPFGGDELPASVDLSDKMPPIGNQGKQQSCVAWAVAYALKSYQEKVELGQQYRFSPSYIYNQINKGMNVPTYITDALDMLSEQGVCQFEDMPYNEDDWTTLPGEKQKLVAKPYRIDFWRQVNTVGTKEIKAQLSAGYPVVIGASISREFQTDGFAQKAAFIWKDPGVSIGGHCMLLVGYDDAKNAFKVMNSWGTEWGDNGFGWIDYQIFKEGVTIPYGFVAKDAFTQKTDVVDNNTTTNKDNNYYDNNPTDNNKNNQDYYTPKENPTQFDESIAFKSTNVEHNVLNPSDRSTGYNMKIEGTLDIPAAYGRKFQIAVHVYNSDTKQQVKSLMYPTYADINGFAAGYTPEYDIEAKGFRNGTWWINIPYNAIDMPRGRRTYFYAIATLFVDNFGIAFGDKIEFYVDMP